jgi:polysaccharide export outer membrane protein
MRGARLLLPILAALAVSACARQQPAYYVIDPNTGQPVPVVAQQPLAPPQYAQPSYGQPQYVQQPQYAPPQYAQQPQTYAAPAYQPPVAPPRAASTGQRGLFTSRPSAPQTYAQQPYVAQPQYAVPQGGPYVAAQNAYALAPAAPAYTLDSGDRLRVVVFGQDGITNGYTVDAGGNVNLPLVGTVPARGYSTQQLSQMIAERLKQGYVREPHVTVEVEAYRPFFILGEVTTPGQYPYVANMTAETAIAIAGGFAPRASKSTVKLTRNAPGQQMHGDVPLGFPLRPGDTVVVKERWF